MPPLPFAGTARRLAPSDLDDAARELGCSLAAVKAVLTVETGGAGGFLADGSGRPRILFEAHLFSAATRRLYDASHPDISVRSWSPTLYRGGAAEYDRLARAVALDRPAALASASWGLFQVLGQNARSLGYADVETFVAKMAESEDAHLEAFIAFCRVNALLDALRKPDWTTFARRYNGPQFAKNLYDVKLDRAYRAAGGHGAADPARDAMVQIGSAGDRVKAIQGALIRWGEALVADGIYGRATEAAVMRFQVKAGLVADGAAGPATLAALGIP